jgi:nitrate/TMAO reductase-like tetraheme cytochrome c subunit
VTAITLTIAAVAALAALLLAVRTPVTRSREGKILAFFALFLLPVVAASLGFTEHMEKATTREFCLSCHVMNDYGKSLYQGLVNPMAKHNCQH